MSSQNNKKMWEIKGMTFLELLIALGILGLLVAITVPNYLRFSREAKRTAVLSNLMYIHGLFQLNYRQNGHYGGVDIPETSLPDGYCGIVIFSTEGCSKPAPWHIQGACSKPAIKYHSANSGFVVIAYGEDEGSNSLDVSLDYKKETFKGAIFNKQAKLTDGFKTELKRLSECANYSVREDCRRAGCRWFNSACIQPSGC